MKRGLVLLLAFAALLPGVADAQAGDFVIEGTAGTPAPLRVRLHYANPNGRSVVKVAQVSDGKFRLEGSVEDVGMAQMIFVYANGSAADTEPDLFDLVLGPETFAVSTADSVKNAVITGSALNSDFQALEAALAPAQARNDELFEIFRALPEAERTPGKRAELQTVALANLAPAVTGFIAGHLASPIALQALTYLMQGEWDAAQVGEFCAQIDPSVRETYTGKAMASAIEGRRRTAIGAEAPGFTQATPDGREVSLADYRGGYVLLDFWNSGCGPCRYLHPYLQEMYDKYKAKGFEILAVSVDKQRRDWVAAIEKDGVTWTQVSDLQGWDNAAARLYGIFQLPSNFLIDPQGRIIGRNLHPDDLETRLATLYP